eukprot:gnl/TRDRNA2_/TRDRNA2_73597_c0_seq1.p1 gnl/TRDRNA2_/TRDRNA2_73597_c0~~gnl/TRDRNA2_/TRDRNA2_73597_c0_seq1.p1  ORF type:complete len:266 (-),score=35.49 gnl/TRDRNA2_/TRDRNA2_73597_c0_seq1:323-1120(-)
MQRSSRQKAPGPRHISFNEDVETEATGSATREVRCEPPDVSSAPSPEVSRWSSSLETRTTGGYSNATAVQSSAASSSPRTSWLSGCEQQGVESLPHLFAPPTLQVRAVLLSGQVLATVSADRSWEVHQLKAALAEKHVSANQSIRLAVHRRTLTDSELLSDLVSPDVSELLLQAVIVRPGMEHEILLGDSNPLVRAAAAEALGDLGETAADSTGALVDLLQEKERCCGCCRVAGTWQHRSSSRRCNPSCGEAPRRHKEIRALCSG